MSTTRIENKRGNKVKTAHPLYIELRYINGKTLHKFSVMYTYIRVCVQKMRETIIYNILKVYFELVF